MTVVQQISPLAVQDPDFLISSTIERCPRVMMARELMQNAIEAAMRAPGGKRVVEVRAVDMGGVRKLSLWNTGPGLGPDELREMTNLASSIGKTLGLDANFGMGAKVASLPSNKYGMRYRSCLNGQVSQVIIAKRGNTYGRVRFDFGDGTFGDVADVTAVAVEEGQDTSFDWTEVVLLGNRLEQDTVADPYDGDPKSTRQWLQDELYHRFYRIPDGVQILMQPGTHKLDGRRTFKTLQQRIKEDVFAQYEAVTTEDGITIHYLYDPPYDQVSGKGHNASVSGALQTDASTCAVVWRNEMYAVKKGRQWTRDAPACGITFGAKHISVHIELPDNYPVLADGYRQFLRFNGGAQDQVEVAHFSALALQNRPQWVIDLVRQYAPDSGGAGEIRDELQELLNNLRIQREGPRPNSQGTTGVNPQPGAPGMDSERGGPNSMPRGGGRGEGSPRPARPADLTSLPPGAKPASTYDNVERAPEVLFIRTQEEAEEKELEGRAARYIRGPNQLIVNLLYPAVDQMRQDLETFYADVGDQETMRGLVQVQSEKTMTLRIGRAVVFALAKSLSPSWTLEDVGKAMSPESLSIAADDYWSSMETARRSLGQQLRPGPRRGAQVEAA
ncbi:ATP-binding protein [Roseicella sp. DB1501]|uniref:ATP-binding protein n=1 Tax=Roseicella sp. DB1501 TaxID=2730925 RepID=UPI001492B55E|nr:ATP-binding protein [Roseicella sp. DB1501]NOG73502.1 ATP-binding protein [Roseicella sp. DB1501]